MEACPYPGSPADGDGSDAAAQWQSVLNRGRGPGSAPLRISLLGDRCARRHDAISLSQASQPPGLAA